MSNYASNRADDRPSLSMDERIVWISDNGPEYGNIRWLGKLPDLGEEWMAGVEFDNPVGSGTGLYRDRQLFVTPLNHASLVPVIGLLKASDFECTPEPPARSSSVKSINSRQLLDDQDRDLAFALNQSLHDLNGEVNHIDQHYSTRENHRTSHQSNNYSTRKTVFDNHQQKLRNPITSSTNNSRVRHIPIQLDDNDHDKNTCRQVNSSDHYSLRAQSNHSTSESENSRIRELADSFSQVSLNREQQKISLLPPPALNIRNGETKNSSQLLSNLFAKFRGIQGHNNSCYLDATLFAMFSSTTLFDSLLYRPARKNDIPKYEEIQRILREEIVRPLRENNFVSAERVMTFRTLLEQSSSVAGLTDEEKDPEEFLSLLLGQILKAEPYLKLSSGGESFLYQLIVEKDKNVTLPSIQDLFEQSFFSSTVRLREIPPCLMLQMPRFGRQYKMYPRIMPSLKLDITDVLESVPRACGYRGKDCDNIARYECKDCFGERSGRIGARLSTITYCHNCFQSKHFGKSHSTGIEDHDKTKTILDKTPLEAISRYSNASKTNSSSKEKDIPRVEMDLFAVLSIETSHYVSFVKCGQDPQAPWCFFDSMADRRGEQDGYNIPEVVMFDEFSFWTSDKGSAYLLNHPDDKLLPEKSRRLICDAYLCFYQYSGLLTYR